MLNVILHPSERRPAQINDLMGPFKDQAAVKEDGEGQSLPDVMDESEVSDDDEYQPSNREDPMGTELPILDLPPTPLPSPNGRYANSVENIDREST
jgi:hypothetical protein